MSIKFCGKNLKRTKKVYNLNFMVFFLDYLADPVVEEAENAEITTASAQTPSNVSLIEEDGNIQSNDLHFLCLFFLLLGGGYRK